MIVDKIKGWCRTCNLLIKPDGTPTTFAILGEGNYPKLICNNCESKEPNMLKLEVGKTYRNQEGILIKIVHDYCPEGRLEGCSRDTEIYRFLGVDRSGGEYRYDRNGGHKYSVHNIVKEHKPLHKHKCEFYVNFYPGKMPDPYYITDKITNAHTDCISLENTLLMDIPKYTKELAVNSRSEIYHRTLKVTVISEEVEE